MSIALATKGVIAPAGTGGGAQPGAVQLTLALTPIVQLGPITISLPNQLDVTLVQITQLGP